MNDSDAPPWAAFMAAIPLTSGLFEDDASSPSTYNPVIFTPNSTPRSHTEDQQVGSEHSVGDIAANGSYPHSALQQTPQGRQSRLQHVHEPVYGQIPFQIAEGFNVVQDDATRGMQAYVGGVGIDHEYAFNSALATSMSVPVPWNQPSDPLVCQGQRRAEYTFPNVAGGASTAAEQTQHAATATPLFDPLENSWNINMRSSDEAVHSEPLWSANEWGMSTTLPNFGQIRDINENPWTHLSVGPREPSQTATCLPSRGGVDQTTTSVHRVSSKGAVEKKDPRRHRRPREVSAIREVVSEYSDFTSPASADAITPEAQKQGFGGRIHPLNDRQKANARTMRYKVACWICALQRVTCSPDQVCIKCSERLSGRGLAHPLTCDRTMLIDMIHDFLPPRMAQTHELGVMRGYVNRRMNGWRWPEGSMGIVVDLTVGYGPALTWPMHEFVPRTRDAVVQLQWILDGQGRRTCTERYSPPLAIRTLGQRDYDRFESFVDRLIDGHLEQFRQTYCEEQDDEPFRRDLLSLLCTLYQNLPANTGDETLKQDLRSAMRAIITTDIMLHHVTLDEASKTTVISQMTIFNDPMSYETFTSPKLANRQLKSFFQTLQKCYLEKVLDRFHKILRMTKGKSRERSWLSSFVLMLTLAMCQEEMQHTRFLRADGERVRRERTLQEATQEARQDCQRGDRGFDFLVKLFNCKYSPAKRYAARWPDWRNTFDNAAEDVFLEGLARISQENRINLLTRQSLEVLSASDTSYKSRLVARFLVGFMGLGNQS